MVTYKRLLAGLDTIQAAYYMRRCSLGGFDFEPLMLAKEELRADKGRDGTLIELGNAIFMLRSYGSSSGYPLVLDHAEYTIQCGEFNNPSFFVTYRSQALWQRGARALHGSFLGWAESVGLEAFRPESLSRVDFTFDYQIPEIDFDGESMVSLSTKDAQYREDGKLQTLTYGKGDVVLRIYDKVAEIAQRSEKVWFFELWGVKENVWRIEWQVRKDVLRRFGIRTYEDLFGGQSDVLRYLASEHDSLRVRTVDSNRSRWPVHPLWEDLMAQIESFNSQGVYREIDPQAVLNERLMRIAISVHGYHKRVAAIISIQNQTGGASLGESLERLNALIRKVHNPLSWQVDVKMRRDQMLVGAGS